MVAHGNLCICCNYEAQDPRLPCLWRNQLQPRFITADSVSQSALYSYGVEDQVWSVYTTPIKIPNSCEIDYKFYRIQKVCSQIGLHKGSCQKGTRFLLNPDGIECCQSICWKKKKEKGSKRGN